MPDEQQMITGGCLCGAVRYEAREPPMRVGYCHCRRCQRAIGNIFGTAALFRRSAVCIVKGEPAWYWSSATVERGFCVACGSPIVAQHEDRDYTAIWLGTLDEPGAHMPTVQWHCDTRLPWVVQGAELPDETDELAPDGR